MAVIADVKAQRAEVEAAAAAEARAAAAGPTIAVTTVTAGVAATLRASGDVSSAAVAGSGSASPRRNSFLDMRNSLAVPPDPLATPHPPAPAQRAAAPPRVADGAAAAAAGTQAATAADGRSGAVTPPGAMPPPLGSYDTRHMTPTDRDYVLRLLLSKEQVLGTLYASMFPEEPNVVALPMTSFVASIRDGEVEGAEAADEAEERKEAAATVLLTPRLSQAVKKNLAAAAEREALLQRPASGRPAVPAGGRPVSAAWKGAGADRVHQDFLRPASGRR